VHDFPMGHPVRQARSAGSILHWHKGHRIFALFPSRIKT